MLIPPTLEIDRRLNPQGIIPRGKVERRVVWNLLHHLAAAGFQPTLIDDGDEETSVQGYESAFLLVMETLFNLDEAWLYFAKGDGLPNHGVLLIFGNDGWDCVSDWTITKGDPDGFDAAMEAFNGEDYA